MSGTFICALCLREHDLEYSYDRKRKPKPPICLRCETPSYYGWNGRSRSVGLVRDGSFGDRRMTRRLFAVADELEGLARRTQWGGAW